jgi:hypothetical protein
VLPLEIPSWVEGASEWIIQHFSSAYIFIWVRKLDSDSLKETKNWSGRNEVIETSSRLHHFYHKTNDTVRGELQTECIPENMDKYRRNWLLQLQRIPLNRIHLKSYHYRPQGRRTVGRPKKRWRERCNSGDGTDQRVRSLKFMMMMLYSFPLNNLNIQSIVILLMWRIGRAPNSIPIYSYIQQNATSHSLFIWKLLYMFRVVLPPIIRSA